jgi:uncharacterized membrane protein
MLEWHTLVSIGVLGLVSYAMRSGGFLAGGLIREGGALARFFQLAPGNLFVAFVAAACLEGGLASIVGCTASLAVMAATRKEWAALAVGFAAAAVVDGVRLGSAGLR